MVEAVAPVQAYRESGGGEAYPEARPGLQVGGPGAEAAADLVEAVPGIAYVEEEGHFTNFEGKIGAYKKALAPIGDSKPDWEIFGLLQKALAVYSAPKEAVA